MTAEMPPEHVLEEKRTTRLRPRGEGLRDRGKIRQAVAALIRNSRLQLLRPHARSPKYLQLGCGGNLVEGFVNVDRGWTYGQELCWDLNRRLPFESGTISGIFSEHTLEHFEFEVLRDHVFPEMFRVLRPGGVLRIVVPDAELAIDAYLAARQQGLTREAFRSDDPKALTPMMRVTNVFRRIFEPYEMGHKFGWDYQTLEFFLWRAGFTEITRESYMRGRDEQLLIDYRKRQSESLYVEAAKPR